MPRPTEVPLGDIDPPFNGLLPYHTRVDVGIDPYKGWRSFLFMPEPSYTVVGRAHVPRRVYRWHFL